MALNTLLDMFEGNSMMMIVVRSIPMIFIVVPGVLLAIEIKKSHQKGKLTPSHIHLRQMSFNVFSSFLRSHQFFV